MRERPLTMIGWREWLALPDLGVAAIKVKVDTGARTSALHAEQVERIDRDGRQWVRFVVQPWQHDVEPHAVEAPLVGEGEVRSSNGGVELRPIVEIRVAPVTESGLRLDLDPIQVTLTDRSAMGFRMLLGRTALEDVFAVDAGASYLLGRPGRATRRRNRGRAAAARIAPGDPR